MQEEFLTIEEAACDLGRTLPAVYAAIREGRLESEKRYGRKVVSRSALNGYKARTADVGPEGGRPKRPRRKPGRPRKDAESLVP